MNRLSFIAADKITRGAAINTVKRWIPDSEPMAGMTRDFALQLLRRLQSRPKAEGSGSPTSEGENMDEDGQLPQEDIIQTPYLPEQLELPAQSDSILQHLELLFALSTKVPEFLDECVLFLLAIVMGANTIIGYSLRMVEWKRPFKRRFSNSSRR